MKRILSREETKSSGSPVLPHQQVFDWQGQRMTDESIDDLRDEVDRLRNLITCQQVEPPFDWGDNMTVEFAVKNAELEQEIRRLRGELASVREDAECLQTKLREAGRLLHENVIEVADNFGLRTEFRHLNDALQQLADQLDLQK